MLESNLLPTLILISVYFVLKILQTPRWSYSLTILLVLSLYAYRMACFFAPVFALATVILLFYIRVYIRALKLRAILWNGIL